MVWLSVSINGDYSESRNGTTTLRATSEERPREREVVVRNRGRETCGGQVASNCRGEGAISLCSTTRGNSIMKLLKPFRIKCFNDGFARNPNLNDLLPELAIIMLKMPLYEYKQIQALRPTERQNFMVQVKKQREVAVWMT